MAQLGWTTSKCFRVGEIVRETEPNTDIVECLSDSEDTCPISVTCGLKSVLGEARSAFIRILDARTISDVAGSPGAYDALFHIVEPR